MNTVNLVGNLARDPEVGTTPSGVTYTRFTVACNRRFTNNQGEREADFISCVAFRLTGDFIAKYFTKGMKIAIVGCIRTGKYKAQDGSTRFTQNVQVDHAEFVERNPNSAGNAYAGVPEQIQNQNQQEYAHQTSMYEGFQEVDDEELPF